MTMPPLATVMVIGLAIITMHAYYKYVVQAFPDGLLNVKAILTFVGLTAVCVAGSLLLPFIFAHYLPFMIAFAFVMGYFLVYIVRRLGALDTPAHHDEPFTRNQRGERI
jgi:hypothetical protein